MLYLGPNSDCLPQVYSIPAPCVSIEEMLDVVVLLAGYRLDCFSVHVHVNKSGANLGAYVNEK